MVIHSFSTWVNPHPKPHLVVQVFDPAWVFCSNHGFPERQACPASGVRFQQGTHTMKRTYQPSKVRRARTHGFLVRMKSRGGRAVVNARRAKGRKKLSQV